MERLNIESKINYLHPITKQQLKSAMSIKNTSTISSYLTATFIVIGIIASVMFFSSPKANNMPSESSDNSRVCIICRKQFTGNGYEEVSDSVWKQCSNQYHSPICSPSCGMKQTDYIKSIINSLPNQTRK